jgi:hypothetical protein
METSDEGEADFDGFSTLPVEILLKFPSKRAEHLRMISKRFKDLVLAKVRNELVLIQKEVKL